jgi:putative nucleotidyltransferase with HDIG domain
MEPKHLLPTPESCKALLLEFGATHNIVAHCEAVAAIAVELATKLDSRAIEIDIDLVQQGALLHDLGKVTMLRTGEPHGEAGARILRERGYPELASIVLRHLFSPKLTDFCSWSWEERVVHYADKLCIETQAVSLHERLDDIESKHPSRAKLLKSFRPIEEALERSIRAAMQGKS